MKKLTTLVMPMKLVAGGIFFGFLAIYMILVTITARVTGAELEYSVPFYIIIQGAGLSVAVSSMVEMFFGENFGIKIIKNMRFFKRMLWFGLALVWLLIMCMLMPFAFLLWNWNYFLLIGIIVSVMSIIVVAITEMYYRKTGERYTELLRAYKENEPDN